MITNGKKPVHMKIHPDIAKMIKKTAEIFSCTHSQASLIIFKPSRIPISDFLKLSTRDVELRVIFNPKPKKLTKG